MSIDEFWSRVVPFDALISPANRFYWLYLLSALALAFGIMFVRMRAVQHDLLSKTLAAVIRFDVLLHRSALLDYRLAFVNHLVFSFILGSGLVSSAVTAAGTRYALGTVFGNDLDTLAAGSVHVILFVLISMLAYDFADYLQHRLQHAAPVLWEFHKVHHSAEALTPVTAVRVHPLAALFGSAVISTILGLVQGSFVFISDVEIPSTVLFGTNASLVLYYTIGAGHLQHSHIWFIFPEPLRKHLVSPALHIIHHSRDPKHYGKNFGFLFAWWDRIGGSFYVPQPEEQHGLVLGLAAAEHDDFQTVRQLYWTPFRNVLRPLTAAAARFRS